MNAKEVGRKLRDAFPDDERVVGSGGVREQLHIWVTRTLPCGCRASMHVQFDDAELRALEYDAVRQWIESMRGRTARCQTHGEESAWLAKDPGWRGK